MSENSKIKICIIDTGVMKSHPSLKDLSIQGILVQKENGIISVVDDYNDDVGHGTGICSIIYKHNKNIEIFVIKIFSSNDLFADEEKLLFALQYVRDNLDCDILNLSLGSCLIENNELVYKSCKRLTDKGVIIVSAFENGGGNIFPSCL